MSMSVYPTVRLLQNSKIMKHGSHKLCMHIKGIPRWCMNEIWGLELIQTPLLKIISCVLIRKNQNEPSQDGGMPSCSALQSLKPSFIFVLNNSLT